MSRTLRRHRLLRTVLSVGLIGVLLAPSAQAAVDPGRDPKVVGDDPRAYTAPHAGVVAPPRGEGRLAPKTGALIGTHSEDKHTGKLDATDQGILATEEHVVRTLDINTSYYVWFASIADIW